MTLESNIVTEPPATRRLRRLAPWVLLLMLVALIVAPGIITELNDAATTGAPPPEMLGRLTAVPQPPNAGLDRSAL